MKTLFNDLAPFFREGIPEFGLPSVENYVVDKIDLDSSTGIFDLMGSYDNVTFKELSKFEATDARVHIDVSN